MGALLNPHTDLPAENGTLPLKAFQHNSATYNRSLAGHKDIQEIPLNFKNHPHPHYLKRDSSDCTTQRRKNPQIKSTQVTFKINNKAKATTLKGKKSEYRVTKWPK